MGSPYALRPLNALRYVGTRPYKEKRPGPREPGRWSIRKSPSRPKILSGGPGSVYASSASPPLLSAILGGCKCTHHSIREIGVSRVGPAVRRSRGRTPMRIPRIIIAGTHSGCGKTSVAAGLLRALLRRGTSVQPYKVGPDFLDLPHLAKAAGRSCRNLDGWMLPQATLIEVFARSATGVDAAIIEGMMGLYDGVGGAGDEGSTAEGARWLS